jgi:hypothetical protein
VCSGFTESGRFSARIRRQSLQASSFISEAVLTPSYVALCGRPPSIFTSIE